MSSPTSRRPRAILAGAAAVAAVVTLVTWVACSGGGGEAPSKPAATPAPAPAAAPGLPVAPPAPADLPNGLLVSLAQFEVGPDGKVIPKPLAARLEMHVRRGGSWEVVALEDEESNVFHKAMVYGPADDRRLLTLGGTAAALKLWSHGEAGWEGETLWAKDFGGKWSRMRDAEAGDLFGDGSSALAVATHDQGVVATVRPGADGWTVEEIDQEEKTFVHEIELGDLDADGTLEVYATPSEPNKLDGTPQPGKVVRYVPGRGEGRVVVADLGNRHAKEIYVGDVDGDGTDELYVSVEAETRKDGKRVEIVEPVEIRRYEAGTPATEGAVIATIQDSLCRFLTVGDVDGDGKKEMVAAAFKKGLWLLRPGEDPKGTWSATLIDAKSSGFEHASLLADLDGDGTDELYVAADDQGEIRRYVWKDGAFARETIFSRGVKGSVFTWNLMPVPADMVP